MSEFAGWIIFNIFVLVCLGFDLWSFRGNEHVESLREAVLRSLGWIALGLGVGGVVWWWRGSGHGVDYFTAYLIEKSLSVDNLFVFLTLFTYFAVRPAYRHKVLFWGILGALVFRGLFIFVGVAVINRFHWVIYFLGAFLVWTGIRMALHEEREVEPARNPVVRGVRKVFPVTRHYRGSAFFVRQRGRLFATPLLLVLVAVETTDILFAVDSVPAVFAVTRDPFVAYSSNVMAILGLRALFFVVAGAIERFRYLHVGLSGVLVFVGLKMVAEIWYDLPTPVSLAVVLGILVVSVATSMAALRREGAGLREVLRGSFDRAEREPGGEGRPGTDAERPGGDDRGPDGPGDGRPGPAGD